VNSLAFIKSITFCAHATNKTYEVSLNGLDVNLFQLCMVLKILKLMPVEPSTRYGFSGDIQIS
jgi:hypothetical protein